MESYDAVIIGAGPAGLNCAEKLGNTGKSVLLLEKNNVIGPKVCAGGLTPSGLDYLNLPRKLIDYKFNEIRLHTGLSDVRINIEDSPLYTVDRKDLGQWQLKKVKKTDAIVRTGAMVTEIKEDCVVVDGKKIGYEYLVGADGSNSLVRRHLGLDTRDSAIAIQYLVPTTKLREMELFCLKRFGLGYMWIFPHKEYASIGCGSHPKIMHARKLRENFDAFLEKKNIDVSKGVFQGQTINFDYQGHLFRKVFLAGDAAGLVSNLNGGGIYNALVSGEDIANAITGKKNPSKRMTEVIKTKKLHKRVYNLARYAGPLRVIEYELLGIFPRIKPLKKIMKRVFLSHGG